MESITTEGTIDTTGLPGRVITPDMADYDTERRVWNGMIDRRPAAIVKCASPHDVAGVVRWASERQQAFTIRAGGHNAAGAAVRDDQILIDLRPMNDVRVDPERRVVRAGAGTTIGELDAATQAHGLAVPMGVVTETGVAGLTLGGGFGWLRRAHGLSCDNLIGAEIVLASGEIVHTSESERPELLWGLRGGGGGLGVVTEFEFSAHPVGPEVFFAFVIHAGSDAASALRLYREWASRTPDAISSMAVLWHGPEINEVPREHHGQPVVVFAAMHAGPPAEGEAALGSLRTIGSPIADLSAVTPYLEVQQFFDADYPKWEKRYYWTSAFVDDLTDELIDGLVQRNAGAVSSESTIDIWQLGGAPARVAGDATAFGDRTAGFMLGIEANWEHPTDDNANIAWARDVHRFATPWSTGTRYANFPGLYEVDDAVDFHGANGDRLHRLMARVDPHGIFATSSTASE